MRRLLVISTLLVPAAFAPAADAATVRYQDEPRKVRYLAEPGEQNRLTVTQDGRTVTLQDPGASTITIAEDDSNCSVVSPTVAKCVARVDNFRIHAELGDGDDQATLTTVVGGSISGEDGADTLTGGPGDDDLHGDLGNDRLDGAAGKDGYSGGDGDDVIAARDAVREIVACGLGIDTGQADLEDELTDCEGVEKPLAPPTVAEAPAPGADNGLHLGHLPKPERGRSVAVGVKTGVVFVRRPGTAVAVPLDPRKPVPVGSVLDATRGMLSLTVAVPTGVARAVQAGDGTQTADFTGSRFVVAQKAGTGTTELRMAGGNFAQCRPVARSAATPTAYAAAKRKRKRIRSLWGSGHGRFTTRGKNSSATVRGTIWRVTDRCDGTLTTVTRGVVVVHDRVRNRTKVVRKGESYLVRRGATAKRRR